MEWVVKPNVSGGLMDLLDFQPSLHFLFSIAYLGNRFSSPDCNKYFKTGFKVFG